MYHTINYYIFPIKCPDPGQKINIKIYLKISNICYIMEVVYNSLIDDENDDELPENYTEINNTDVIELLKDFPNIIRNSFIKRRLLYMIATN